DLLHLRRRFEQIPMPESREDDIASPAVPRLSSRPNRTDSLLPGMSRLPTPPDSQFSPDALPVLPPNTDDESPNIIEQTCLAARRARAILLQNLANAETPGYRRIHVAFVEQ